MDHGVDSEVHFKADIHEEERDDVETDRVRASHPDHTV